jgi:R3H domain
MDGNWHKSRRQLYSRQLSMLRLTAIWPAAHTLQERKLAHELAEHYGLTTQSLGAEPQRHIELFKTPRSSVPGRCAPLHSGGTVSEVDGASACAGNTASCMPRLPA